MADDDSTKIDASTKVDASSIPNIEAVFEWITAESEEYVCEWEET